MRVVFLPAVALIALASCTPVPVADTSGDEAAIRAVDASMVATLNAHDVNKWLTYFVADGRLLPPGSPPIVGTEAIRSLITGFISPEFAVAHHLEGVTVSKSGDLAYVWYSYELTFKGPDGKPATEKGKDISIYKKASDGTWKLAVDMWSENQAPPK